MILTVLWEFETQLFFKHVYFISQNCPSFIFWLGKTSPQKEKNEFFIMDLLIILTFCHTLLHLDQHCPLTPQNQQKWNHIIWNILKSCTFMKIQFVFRNFEVSPTRVPATSLPLPSYGSKTGFPWPHMATNGNRPPTCYALSTELVRRHAPFHYDLMKHSGILPHISSANRQVSHGQTWPQMVTGLLLAMLCLQNWFVDINLLALLSNLAFCHTWLHINQHCPMAPQNLHNWNHEIWNIFLRFVGFDLVVKKNTAPLYGGEYLLLAMLCLQNWFVDINLLALLSNLAFCHTWLHINQHCPMAPQNLHNWNHEIWNIFLRFVGFDLVVKKNTKPMITIHNSTKTMPEDIHVNADLTFCIHFLIWHQWPYIGHKALFIWPY